MNFTCPACNQKTIFFLVTFLHCGGSGSNRANRFRCPGCDAPLKCSFQLPLVLLCAAIPQLFVMGGSVIGIAFGSLFLALITLFFYPIHRDEESSEIYHGDLGGEKTFDTPLDQGWHKLETTFLATAVFAACWCSLGRLSVWLGWARADVILFVPIILLAILGSRLYIAIIYRVGRVHWAPRLLLDAGVVLFFLQALPTR